MNETSTTAGSPGELLSRRCVSLLKLALKSDIHPNVELKLAWFTKVLMTVESPQLNCGNVCTALELLSFLLTIMVRNSSPWSRENRFMEGKRIYGVRYEARSC